MSKKPRIKTKQEAFILRDYPEAIKFSDTQLGIFWSANEIDVEKDVQDILVNMTESERHGVITVLKLFTKYETEIGNEIWGKRIKRMFPRPAIQTMATTFSFFEISVHARFYNKINEVLNLDTEEFYEEYIDDPALKERMDFIEEYITSKDDELSLAVFALLEGVVLYSSFAFLKHFQSEGKNKLKNIDSGIAFSVRDENLHAEATAWLYRTSCSELGREEDTDLHGKIYDATEVCVQHEFAIIDKIFEKGNIVGITDHQMKNFVMSRANLILKNLNLEPLYKVDYNPIAKWFYRDINVVNFHDFFDRTGNSYTRDWNESKFNW